MTIIFPSLVTLTTHPTLSQASVSRDKLWVGLECIFLARMTQGTALALAWCWWRWEGSNKQ